MKPRPQHCLFPLMGLFALGCSGLGSTGLGYWYEDPQDPSLDQVFFEPDTVLVYAYAAYDGQGLDDFMLEMGNPASALPPVLMFVFADNRYFATGNEDYYCDWVGQMNIEGIDPMGSDDLWLGYAVSLDLLETTCYDMDPDVWGEPTPSSIMESAFLGIGYGPMSAELESVVRPLFAADDAGTWAVEWAPYVFSMTLGTWDDDVGGLVPHEVGFTMSYEMIDGALYADEYDEPVPLPLDGSDEPPEGLLIGYGLQELDPSMFLK